MYKLNEYLHTNNNNLAKNNIKKKVKKLKETTPVLFSLLNLIFSVLLIISYNPKCPCL
jgi:hypothetical protein